jgi:hypothetical protein
MNRHWLLLFRKMRRRLKERGKGAEAGEGMKEKERK